MQSNSRRKRDAAAALEPAAGVAEKETKQEKGNGVVQCNHASVGEVPVEKKVKKEMGVVDVEGAIEREAKIATASVKMQLERQMVHKKGNKIPYGVTIQANILDISLSAVERMLDVDARLKAVFLDKKKLTQPPNISEGSFTTVEGVDPRRADDLMVVPVDTTGVEHVFGVCGHKSVLGMGPPHFVYVKDACIVYDKSMRRLMVVAAFQILD